MLSQHRLNHGHRIEIVLPPLHCDNAESQCVPQCIMSFIDTARALRVLSTTQYFARVFSCMTPVLFCMVFTLDIQHIMCLVCIAYLLLKVGHRYSNLQYFKLMLKIIFKTTTYYIFRRDLFSKPSTKQNTKIYISHIFLENIIQYASNLTLH